MNIFPTNILVICNTTMCIFQKVVKIKSTSHYLYSQKLNIFCWIYYYISKYISNRREFALIRVQWEQNSSLLILDIWRLRGFPDWFLLQTLFFYHYPHVFSAGHWRTHSYSSFPSWCLLSGNGGLQEYSWKPFLYWAS